MGLNSVNRESAEPESFLDTLPGIPVLGVGDRRHPWVCTPEGELSCLTCGTFHDEEITRFLTVYAQQEAAACRMGAA